MGTRDILLNSVLRVKNARGTTEGKINILGHGQIYPQLNFVLEGIKVGKRTGTIKGRANREFNQLFAFLL
jgi:hypothetical protein